ncbi:hypothetical protein KPL71_026455 [Citrus sinensis]|uniref:Uncharacterized protein n=1 Tax=Citrus sinensis TaxID=2711 RepID=A0ACB8HZL4_CITSI|nr:hypothetical protein KPL71_026455 [Citrus sinensis]
MATKTEDPSTSTPIVKESSDDNNNDQGSQTEPAPSVPPVSEQSSKQSSKPSSSPWFTFDDIPRHKWQARHQKFTTWIDVQMTSPNGQSQSVLREFCSRFTGSLRDWFESLGEYRQLQLIQTTILIALAVIYEQFIGEPATSTEASRKEYHWMKCCSLKRHHLEMHYKRMSMLYYKLNGFNDPSLKHVFAASLSPELQPELQRQLTAFNLDIANVSLGKIFQLTMLCLDKIYVEPIFSEQSEKDDHTTFILADSTDSYPDDISVISTIQEINHICPKLTGPSVKISVIPSKFHKHASVIGFLDTGAQCSMLNPRILSPDYWEHHTEYFRAANGKVLETSLITKKPIGIQFFPNCIIWQKIVGSDLPDKDLLLGFNILQLLKHLFITPTGIKFKQMFMPYTDVLRLYTLSDTSPPYTSISQKLLALCPENHSQFTHPSPLWINEQFFIHLPFKLNEDVNLTKATHPRMPPSDLTLAKQECTILLRQGLIEPTTSDWACQAFYVEKQSELVHGKKRLVIDYQPLNAFLKDDKFPLPEIQSLFIHLQGAKVFSKFDLKVGFWQLGISPEDRPKTAFCIPDVHYQWTVLPFGLKVAPSLFQKAMVKIFSSILHHALIYIDDILLFSHDH